MPFISVLTRGAFWVRGKYKSQKTDELRRAGASTERGVRKGTVSEERKRSPSPEGHDANGSRLVGNSGVSDRSRFYAVCKVMRIIWGLLITIAGALLVIYGEKVYETFGAVPFAEKYLGTEGGSRLFYKLLGVLACIIGFMVMTNMLGSLLLAIFGGIIPGARTQ